MMERTRFTALAASYGGDVARWPRVEQDEARKLLEASATARAVLDAARELDAAIGAASAREAAQLEPHGGEAAALARIRAGVARRIDALSPPNTRQRSGRNFTDRLASLFFGRAGLATAGGFAVAAGLLLGALATQSPAPDILVATLEPTPVVIQSE